MTEREPSTSVSDRTYQHDRSLSHRPLRLTEPEPKDPDMSNTLYTPSAAMRAPRNWPRTLVIGAATLALAGSLVACSGSSGTASAASSTQAVAPITQGSSAAGAAAGGTIGGGAAVGGVRPAAYGTIAALSAGTMQVQNTTSQTTVTYTASTTFTQTSKTTLSAVKVGSCVTAAAAFVRTSTTGQAPTGAAQTPATRAAVTALTAATVVITDPLSGKCTGGFGGLAGSRPTGVAAPGSAAPQAGSGAAPTRAAGIGSRAGRLNFGERASGQVTSVSGSTIVVEETNRQTSATTKVTVTVTPTTVYNQTTAAKPAALKVGLCAVAIGAADSTGAVAAKSIALSPGTANGCTSGFGGGGFGGRNRAGSQGGANRTPTTNG